MADAAMIGELLSVLKADDPEASLTAAVCVLRRRGLAAPVALHAPWLELTYGKRTLQLATDIGVVEPDASSRAQLHEVLAGLLARLSERDALRALREHTRSSSASTTSWSRASMCLATSDIK